MKAKADPKDTHIKFPVRRGDNQVFIAIVDADGNEICVCESEEMAKEIIAMLNNNAPD